MKDIFCDGLGACLGKCPQNAITIIKRDADEFDEEAAEEHIKTIKNTEPVTRSCPSTQTIQFKAKDGLKPEIKEKNISRISSWPIQLKLLPPTASFLKGADLLITADCVPFAYANFHEDMLNDKVLAVGCPKLDDATLYRNKLAEIFRSNNIQSITVVNMEVPCCFGLKRIVQEALELSGKKIPFKQETISIKGEKLA